MKINVILWLSRMRIVPDINGPYANFWSEWRSDADHDDGMLVSSLLSFN